MPQVPILSHLWLVAPPWTTQARDTCIILNILLDDPILHHLARPSREEGRANRRTIFPDPLPIVAQMGRQWTEIWECPTKRGGGAGQIAGQKDFTHNQVELWWERLHGSGLGALPTSYPSPQGEGVAETGVSVYREGGGKSSACSPARRAQCTELGGWCTAD